MKNLMITAAFLVASVSALVAQPRGNNNKSYRDDNKKIQQGVRSGKLTKQEVAQLQAEENRLRATIYRYKRDGYLSRREREHLAQLERQLDMNIWKQKNDRDVRYAYRY